MIVAEKEVSRRELEGADIAGALDVSNYSGNQVMDNSGPGNRNEMDVLDL